MLLIFTLWRIRHLIVFEEILHFVQLTPEWRYISTIGQMFRGLQFPKLRQSLHVSTSEVLSLCTGESARPYDVSETLIVSGASSPVPFVFTNHEISSHWKMNKGILDCSLPKGKSAVQVILQGVHTAPSCKFSFFCLWVILNCEPIRFEKARSRTNGTTGLQ